MRRVPGVHRWVGVGDRERAAGQGTESGKSWMRYMATGMLWAAGWVLGIRRVPGVHWWLGSGGVGGRRVTGAGLAWPPCTSRPAELAAHTGMSNGGRTPAACSLLRLVVDGGPTQRLCLPYTCRTPSGRRPYTSGLGLEALGIKTDQRGRIEVDSHFRWVHFIMSRVRSVQS